MSVQWLTERITLKMGNLESSVSCVIGSGIVVRGNDIDTDRIIPARYLRNITFEGLGSNAFEDDRKSNQNHPFDDSRFHEASVLFVNTNFGCGSSREHAPQALMRWGIRAIVGHSFAEIFQGNCIALGVPCVTSQNDDLQKLMDTVEKKPSEEIYINLKDKILTCGELQVKIQIPNSNRLQLLEGSWDATGLLQEGADAARIISNGLPYISGF